MAMERRHKKRRRQRGRFPGLYRLVSVVVILIAIVVACALFFRVDDVTVKGNARYPDGQIIDVSGVKKGDNLFAINKNKVQRELRSRLPYIQGVSVKRKLPDTLVITVTEGDAVAAVKDEGRWWLMGASGKLLEEVRSPGRYAAVTGVTPLAPAVGTYLAAEEAQQGKVNSLKELVAALENHKLMDKVTAIDLSADYEAVFVYDDRFTVYLSTTLEKGMDYWVRRFGVYKDDPSVVENQAYFVYIRDGELMRFIPNREN